MQRLAQTIIDTMAMAIPSKYFADPALSLIGQVQYIHTYIHAYIHTNVQYIHAYIQTHMNYFAISISS